MWPVPPTMTGHTWDNWQDLASMGPGMARDVDVAEKCESQTVSMTKADLIAVIADKLKFPWARAELLVDLVFGCLEQSMSRGEKSKFVLHAQTIPIPSRGCTWRVR